MKDRHLQGEDHPLTVEEILDETNQLDIGSTNKNVRTTYYVLELTTLNLNCINLLPVAYD